MRQLRNLIAAIFFAFFSTLAHGATNSVYSTSAGGNVGAVVIQCPPSSGSTSIICFNVTGENQAAMTNDLQNTVYSCTFSFTPASTPTNVAIITASSTKVIRIRAITYRFLSTSASAVFVSYKLYSSLYSGGTYTSVTPQYNDSGASAPDNACGYFTANPTAGTLVSTWQPFWAVTGVSGNNFASTTVGYNNSNLASIMRASSTAYLAIDLGGLTLPAGFTVGQLTLMYTEDAN